MSLGLCLNKKKRFYFTTNRKTLGSSKNGTRDFKINPLFMRSTYFYVTITRDFISFQCFNFETIFSEKLKSFLETTIIESTTFPYKTDLSKANLKTNRMESTK